MGRKLGPLDQAWANLPRVTSRGATASNSTNPWSARRQAGRRDGGRSRATLLSVVCPEDEVYIAGRSLRGAPRGEDPSILCGDCFDTACDIARRRGSKLVMPEKPSRVGVIGAHERDVA